MLSSYETERPSVASRYDSPTEESVRDISKDNILQPSLVKSDPAHGFIDNCYKAQRQHTEVSYAEALYKDITAGEGIACTVTQENISHLEQLKCQLVNGFINSYFTIQKQASDAVRNRVETITDLAVSRLFESGADVSEVLGRPDMQECVRVMQTRFASTGDNETAQLMVDILIDYSLESPDTILKAIAEDALATLPKLTWKQLDILSLLFLLKYTRGLENAHPENFYRYVTEYLIPFSTSIPLEHSFYQHIEYLGCGILGPTSVSFERIILDSYPAIFQYVGFSRNDLDNILAGQEFDTSLLVPSLYHDSHNDMYIKINAIDDVSTINLLTEADLDPRIVSDLVKLQHSRRIECQEDDVRKVLPLIHPDLTYLSDKWDESPLRIARLSVKGIYIAYANIRRKLGLNFDLSTWIS